MACATIKDVYLFGDILETDGAFQLLTESSSLTTHKPAEDDDDDDDDNDGKVSGVSVDVATIADIVHTMQSIASNIGTSEALVTKLRAGTHFSFDVRGICNSA